MQLYRHGDVLVGGVDEIPAGAKKLEKLILAYGEVTGHTHRIEDPTAAEMFEHEGLLYLRVVVPTARLVHEEHKPIELPEGTYRVWQQREYTPQRIRRVYD
jgi:hypothetical protein